MATEIEAREGVEEAKNEPTATEKQRTALYHWGVSRERTEDPGLTRSEASKWLGALIAAKRRDGEPSSREEGRRPSGSADVRNESSPPDSKNGNGSRSASSPLVKLSRTEPQSLEIELTTPTGIPYSSIRVRTGASRKPGEALVELSDRLMEELLTVARRGATRVEAALGPRSEVATDPAAGYPGRAGEGR